jgi:hypothetical protein
MRPVEPVAKLGTKQRSINICEALILAPMKVESLV